MLIEVLPKVHVDPALVAAVYAVEDDTLFIRLADYTIRVSVDSDAAEETAREIREKINIELDWLKFEDTPNAWDEEPARC